MTPREAIDLIRPHVGNEYISVMCDVSHRIHCGKASESIEYTVYVASTANESAPTLDEAVQRVLAIVNQQPGSIDDATAFFAEAGQ